ncbi:hypothetical protein LR48_Vigan11g096300 [Vigna angularis]|uniref:Uncharacterized protein n=1 Tax=Phaseolus angularis TaxID=3914 RepID=A0A0L9VS92_PHAAN|nr:hypothetical protein LR48_Vigan11g096300 [Vigna angularis]
MQTWTINNYPKELMLITITTSFSINRLDAHLALACLSWRKLKDGSPYCAGTYVGDGSRQPSELELAQAFHQGKHDCGVIMLKAMEIWDGDEKYNGKSMPQYTTKELLEIRKKYICDWILDNENIRRMEALELYGIV